MSASFHVDAGPFSIHVDLDDSGIHMRRDTLARRQTESIAWHKITAATLVRPTAADASDTQKEEQVAQFLGPEAVAKFHELQGKVGQIFVAYSNETRKIGCGRQNCLHRLLMPRICRSFKHGSAPAGSEKPRTARR